MKAKKIFYWISTLLICGLMIFSATMYFMNYEGIAGFFQALGFPTWLIYPLAVAKLLAVVAILTKLSKFLKEWAYAGIFFDVVMAFTAHTLAGDGGWQLAGMGIVFVLTSYVLDGMVFGNALLQPKKFT